MFFRLICLFLLSTSIFANSHSFEDFLSNIRQIATEQGVSKSTIDKAFFGLSPNLDILEADAKQAEFSQNFWHYINKRVNQTRLNNGYDTLKQNTLLLNKVSQKYGVPDYILVAFLGLESNYGTYTGKLSLIQSLATLAFDPRRSDFFTRELVTLLKLIDKGKIPIDAKGSWAGAMGAVQFMPSNVLAYGVDADKDGDIDLWSSQDDIYASAANFLKHLGWKKGEKWGREVTIPKNFDYRLTGLQNKKKVTEWGSLGVQKANGSALPNSSMEGSLIVPMGHQGPAFLVYQNFRVILGWNRSQLYALSVGYLADRINGQGRLRAKPLDEPLLSKEDILSIQETLNILGYDAGVADGVLGPKTRAATRQFQSDIGMVADGYVGYELLQKFQ
ncbi:MAG TPA: lytic murein transglycosylase [Gammaproteobacteria bacterium]|jgi:membrane-bound lytic murein transglycosylase B|nr:lytic murein transglycosylase [Gammaproteobacteria bacterium]